MAQPAIHALEQVRTALNAFRRLSRLRWNRHCGGRFFLREARRERLDVCHQVRALLPRQRIPRRHSAGVHTTRDGVIEIRVQGESSRGSRAAFIGCLRKVPRFRVKVSSVLAASVTVLAMAKDAVTLVQIFAMAGVSGGRPNMTLLRYREKAATCQQRA